jgi:nicotinamidase-related amidase
MSWYTRKKQTVLRPVNDNAGQETAVLIIDDQEKYADADHSGTTETEQIAGKIARLAPEFRKAGAALYFIYFDHDDKADLRRARLYMIDFDENNDTLVRKIDDSAFEGSDIRAELRRRGHKRLLGCGFNLSFCVKSTLIDGCDEFEVVLMRDLSCNGQTVDPPKDLGIGEMKRAGVIMSDSDTELRRLQRRQQERAAAPGPRPVLDRAPS